MNIINEEPPSMVSGRLGNDFRHEGLRLVVGTCENNSGIMYQGLADELFCQLSDNNQLYNGDL